MRHIDTNPVLKDLFDRVLAHAGAMGRTLPEIRFFIMEPLEFASLLEKHVYPVSPINIWEGRNMVEKKHRIRTGQESALYYEVVQTGNPSYAYLNATNSPMVQASVMAHVVGHCEFSELNVLKDSNPDRTEYVMYLVRKVNQGRLQMGDANYHQYWNACESMAPLCAPNSQFNLENSVESDTAQKKKSGPEADEEPSVARFQFYSQTMEKLFAPEVVETAFKKDLQAKIRKETLSRRGFKLKAPCQDILGFLARYAPASQAERAVLEYFYTVNIPKDFVMRTQIMNEGWAMYWEKKIMLELFKEQACKGIIDYARIFSGVCYPRPWFMRNPYHVGYHLWCHIESLYRKGRVSLAYVEETDQALKENWEKTPVVEPIKAMEELLRTVTDYEFLRRFLTKELVEKFYLNRIDKRLARQLRVKPGDVHREDDHYVYLEPGAVKSEMLKFFTHFNQPRLYVVDSDFLDGGLLLFHRNDGRHLKKAWIEPTLKNLNMVWKAPVYLLTHNSLYQYASKRFQRSEVSEITFEQVVERMQHDDKPVKLV